MQRDAALGGQRADEFQRLRQRVHDADRLQGKLHAPGLDARDVEHLVDQPEQMPARADDVADAVRLRRRQVLHLQDLAEAEDGVERRAQLVAHAREEIALGAVGVLGFLLGLVERGFAGLALGDVAQVRGEERQPLHGDARDGQLHLHERAVEPPGGQFHALAQRRQDAAPRRPAATSGELAAPCSRKGWPRMPARVQPKVFSAAGLNSTIRPS